jgi:hypothetical protein
MWLVERSDSGHRSSWATGQDAKHYIACLGRVVPIAPFTFEVWLPTGGRITAAMIRK